MKVLIFIPAYRREEITGKCYACVRYFIDHTPDGFEFDCLCVVSTESDRLLANGYGLRTCMAPNRSLGRKKNMGLAAALHALEWDYLMELDSDNLIHPKLMAYYTDCFGKYPFFGTNRGLFLHMASGRLLEHIILGSLWVALRCVSREICLKCWPMWPDQNDAMGWGQEQRIIEVVGGITHREARFHPVFAPDPLFLDMKAGHNVTPWEHLLINGGREIDGSEKDELLEPFQRWL